MSGLPTQGQLARAFPAGALVAAQSLHAGVREAERAGRLMRDVQPQDNCTSQHRIEANFASSGTGTPVAVSVSFGRIAFVSEPCMTSGSKRLGLSSDPAGQPFAPATHYAVPCLAQVLAYTTTKGFYTGASLLLFAIGPVPEGFRAEVDVVFTGPAVRLGPTTASV